MTFSNFNTQKEMKSCLLCFLVLFVFTSCDEQKNRINKKLVTVGYEVTVMTEKPCSPNDSIAVFLNSSTNPYYENKRLVGQGVSEWIYPESIAKVMEVAKDSTWVKVKVTRSAAPKTIGCVCYVPMKNWLINSD